MEYMFDTEVYSVEVDATGSWMPYTLVKRMQDMADMHANKLQLSRADMLQKGVVWIIARSNIQVYRYPKIGEKIRIRTFYGTPTRIGFDRYFVFSTQDGETLCKATTLWLLADLNTHKFVSPKTIGMEFPDVADMREEMPEAEKIRFEGEITRTEERVPAYSDFDVNVHVNNARYIQWACDLFPLERFHKHCLGSLKINYVAEVQEGETVRLELSDNGDSFMLRGVEALTENEKFIASGTFVERK